MPIDKRVGSDVQRLEAERLRPSRELEAADRIAADLTAVIAILARELPSFPYRSRYSPRARRPS